MRPGPGHINGRFMIYRVAASANGREPMTKPVQASSRNTGDSVTVFLARLRADICPARASVTFQLESHSDNGRARRFGCGKRRCPSRGPSTHYISQRAESPRSYIDDPSPILRELPYAGASSIVADIPKSPLPAGRPSYVYGHYRRPVGGMWLTSSSERSHRPEAAHRRSCPRRPKMRSHAHAVYFA